MGERFFKLRVPSIGDPKMATGSLSPKAPSQAQVIFSELKSLVSKAFSQPYSLLAEGGASVEWYTVKGSYAEIALAKTLKVYELTDAELKELVSLLAQDAHEVLAGYHYDYHKVFGGDTYTHDVWMDVIIDPDVNKVYLRLFYIASIHCFNAGKAQPVLKAELRSSWNPEYHLTREYYDVKRAVEGFLFAEEPAKMLKDVTLEVFKLDEKGLTIAMQGYIGSVDVPEKYVMDIWVWLENSNLVDANNSSAKTLEFATVTEPYENVLEERRLYLRYDPDYEAFRLYGRVFISFWCPGK